MAFFMVVLGKGWSNSHYSQFTINSPKSPLTKRHNCWLIGNQTGNELDWREWVYGTIIAVKCLRSGLRSGKSGSDCWMPPSWWCWSVVSRGWILHMRLSAYLRIKEGGWKTRMWQECRVKELSQWTVDTALAHRKFIYWRSVYLGIRKYYHTFQSFKQSSKRNSPSELSLCI